MDSPTDQAPHISTTYPVGDTCASTGRQLNKPCLSKRRPPPATCTACSQWDMDSGGKIHCTCIVLINYIYKRTLVLSVTTLLLRIASFAALFLYCLGN